MAQVNDANGNFVGKVAIGDTKLEALERLSLPSHALFDKDSLGLRDSDIITLDGAPYIVKDLTRDLNDSKRQHKMLRWEDYQDDIESPDKVPRPILNEEIPPPPFVEPHNWLRDLCRDVRMEYNLQDTENPRVTPIALVRCSRGGKTRALHELAWALSSENDTDSIIYVSFNGMTSLKAWEKIEPLEALCRRILFAALKADTAKRFRFFNERTVVTKEDITAWLGDSPCILLIDELNLVENTMNEEFADFLKENFLEPSGRALVFSSHVISVNNTLSEYMSSKSERGVKTKKLPIVNDLGRAKHLLKFSSLTPHQALYLGLIPALMYGAKLNLLPHARREHAIQNYVDSGITSERVENLLSTLLTGNHAAVPDMFREFMDIHVDDKRAVAHWIPHHMSQVLLTLSQQWTLPVFVRRCLAAICNQFETFQHRKIQSGDGWEALFTIVLLARCMTKQFCDIAPLHGFDCDVSWNEPFHGGQVNFGCQKVEEFVSGIPFRRNTKSIAIYCPTHAKFEAYDVILAFWGDDLERKLIGYQLKEGANIPRNFAMENMFHRSYLIRGVASRNGASIRRWNTPSDETLDQFFGQSAQFWSPQCWSALKATNRSVGRL